MACRGDASRAAGVHSRSPDRKRILWLSEIRRPSIRTRFPGASAPPGSDGGIRLASLRIPSCRMAGGCAVTVAMDPRSKRTVFPSTAEFQRSIAPGFSRIEWVPISLIEATGFGITDVFSIAAIDFRLSPAICICRREHLSSCGCNRFVTRTERADLACAHGALRNSPSRSSPETLDPGAKGASFNSAG